MFGRINPGPAVSGDEMVEAAKIKQEREANPPHIKQMVNRYADASTGEVADTYDDPIDQAKYEKSVGKFREALKNLTSPEISGDAKQPRKRTIRKPLPGIG